MLTAIRNWVIKTMMKGQTGVVRTLPKQEIIEMNTQITAERIMRNGINPNDLKTVGQVENVVKQIDEPRVISADSAEGASIARDLGIAKKADVFDIEGNKIDTSKGIMGGKQIQPINMTVEERTGGLLKGKYESDEAIKARLDADNKKGIAGIKINLVDDSIAKIKSMEPMDAMKEANLVAGKKGRYANLDDNQVKKIMDDTQEHIFQDSSPLDDYATGGRVGLKGGSGFLKFLKKFKIKQSGDDVNEFLSKRQFMKDLVGNTEKARKARELKMLKEAADEARRNPGFKFKNVDVDKEIRPILDRGLAEALKKNRKLNADGGRIGLFMGSAYPKGTAALREMLKFFGKKSDSVKNPSDILKIVNPKQFNKMLEDPKIYGKFDVEKGIAAPDLIKDMQKKMMSDRQSTVKEMLGSAKNIKKSDDTTLKYKNEMIEEMIEKGVDRKMAEEMAETISKMAESAAGKVDTPKLTEEGILQLENILKNMETGGKTARDLNADGGRIGLKGGSILNFIKNMTMNKKSPLKFGKDYLKNVKEKTLRANETGKFMDLPLAEVGIPATSGALINNQIRKKLKAMNEEQKEEQLKNFIMELENDEFYQKYPDLKDETIASYTEKLFGVKKADGGRIGLKKGSTNSPGHPSNRTLSPSTNKATVGPGGDGPQGPPRVINPPPRDNNPSPKDNKIVERLKAANTSRLSPFQKFLAHDRFTNMMKASKTPNYHQMGGFDFMARFPDINPSIAKGLASAYQNLFEYGRAVADGPGGITFDDAGKKATEESRLNAVGIDDFSDPNSETYKQYTSDTFGLKPAAVQMADGGRIGLKGGSVDKVRRLILKAIGAGTAGIAGAKSGLFSFGKGATTQAAKEVAQQTTSSMPPPYFFKLAEKIKMMGDDVTAKSATKDREVVTKFKEYELTEDVATGEMTIQRMKVLDDDSGSYYGKNLTEETYMNYKPGLADETTKGKIPPGEYEEGTALLRNDKEFAGDVVDESFKISDDVLEEVGEAKSIKYASGGLAYMLGE